jgi:hypothetical protein
MDLKIFLNLKDKILYYKMMKNEEKSEAECMKHSALKNSMKPEKITNLKICISCRSQKHIRSECSLKSKDLKCLKCNKFGYITFKYIQVKYN